MFPDILKKVNNYRHLQKKTLPFNVVMFGNVLILLNFYLVILMATLIY